jgi:hypothetical protein
MTSGRCDYIIGKGRVQSSAPCSRPFAPPARTTGSWPPSAPWGHNEYNTNAIAAASLYMLDGYRAGMDRGKSKD